MTVIGNRMKNLAKALAFVAFIISGCGMADGQKEEGQDQERGAKDTTQAIMTGADQLDAYLPLLEGKSVGLMGNQTSVVGADNEHLVDVLFGPGSRSPVRVCSRTWIQG